MCAVSVSAPEGQKRASALLELKIQMVVSCHVGVENQIKLLEEQPSPEPSPASVLNSGVIP